MHQSEVFADATLVCSEIMSALLPCPVQPSHSRPGRICFCSAESNHQDHSCSISIGCWGIFRAFANESYLTCLALAVCGHICGIVPAVSWHRSCSHHKAGGEDGKALHLCDPDGCNLSSSHHPHRNLQRWSGGTRPHHWP